MCLECMMRGMHIAPVDIYAAGMSGLVWYTTKRPIDGLAVFLVYMLARSMEEKHHRRRPRMELQEQQEEEQEQEQEQAPVQQDDPFPMRPQDLDAKLHGFTLPRPQQQPCTYYPGVLATIGAQPLTGYEIPRHGLPSWRPQPGVLPGRFELSRSSPVCSPAASNSVEGLPLHVVRARTIEHSGVALPQRRATDPRADHQQGQSFQHYLAHFACVAHSFKAALKKTIFSMEVECPAALVNGNALVDFCLFHNMSGSRADDGGALVGCACPGCRKPIRAPRVGRADSLLVPCERRRRSAIARHDIGVPRPVPSAREFAEQLYDATLHCKSYVCPLCRRDVRDARGHRVAVVAAAPACPIIVPGATCAPVPVIQPVSFAPLQHVEDAAL